jgi:hypothetical protein
MFEPREGKEPAYGTANYGILLSPKSGQTGKHWFLWNETCAAMTVDLPSENTAI